MSQDITNEAFNSEQIQSDDAVHTNLEATSQAAPSSAVEAGLNDSDASRMSARKEKMTNVKVSSLREIELPGLPSVLTGPRYEALKASIGKVGVILPLIVNEDNQVLDGRSRLNACRELGIKEVKVIHVPSKNGIRITKAAAIHRQCSPVDMATMVLWFHDSGELEPRKKKEPNVKTNILISRWMAEDLGLVRGTSPRHVTGLLKLGRYLRELQSPKEKAVVDAAATLHEALKQIPNDGTPKRQRDPSKAFYRTLEKFEKALEKMGNADVVKDAIETIRSAVAKVTALNA